MASAAKTNGDKFLHPLSLKLSISIKDETSIMNDFNS